MAIPLVKGSGLRRTRVELLLAVLLALLASAGIGLGLVCAVVAAWVAAITYLVPGISSLLACWMWLRITPAHTGFHGRAMWIGPIGDFVDLYGDGAEPFRKWGLTRDQRVEVRVMHDTLDTAFESYMRENT